MNHKQWECIDFVKSCGLSSSHKENEALLWWPFWAWRILAPESDNNQDIFETLVFRLVNAGVKNISELSSLTHLHAQLIHLIVANLTNKGYLASWEVTESGKTWLTTGVDNHNKSKAYYVLQDAYTGDLIHRVFKQFSFIEHIDLTSDYPGYVRNRGKGKKSTPYLLRTHYNTLSEPAAYDIFEAVKRHRLDQNKLKQAGFTSDITHINVEDIKLLSDKPMPIYMEIKLFTEVAEKRSWFLEDPAGLLPSLDMFNKIADKRLKNDKNFASQIDKVLGIAKTEKELTQKEEENIHEAQARGELSKQFAWVSHVPSVEKYTLRMLCSKYVFEKYEKPKEHIIEGLVNNLQLVCEALIKCLCPPNKDNHVWRKVDCKGDYRQQRQQKKKIYLQCSAVDSELAWNFASIKENQLKSAMHEGDQSLRQLLAAFVLSMPEIAERIDTAMPGWLNQILPLAHDRNKASHANDHVINKQDANTHLNFVESLLKVIEKEISRG